MIDSFKSTLYFIKQYWITFLVFCLAGAGLFITSVLLQYRESEFKRSIDRESEYSLSRYTFRVNECDKKSFDSFAQALAENELSPDYIVVSSDCAFGLRTGQSINGRFAAFWPELPISEEDLLLEYGSASFSDPELEIILSHPFDLDLTSVIQHQINDETTDIYVLPTTEIIGNITINNSTPHQPIGIIEMYNVLKPEDVFNSGVLVSYEHFFDVSPFCDTLIIQFDKALEPTEEKLFYSAAANHLSVQQIIKPYQRGKLQWVDDNYKHKISENALLLFLCAVGIFSVFSYLVRLRQPEFRIARIVGATQAYSIKQSVSLYLISLVSSFSLGLALLFVLKSIPPIDRWLITLIAQDIITSSWLYLATLSGCAGFWVVIRLISAERIATEEDQ